MALPLSRLPFEIAQEVRARKWLALLLFVAVSFGVLAAGFLWPYKYESETVIFIDDQNIIRPLMEGSAVATKINDTTSAAQELLWSRSILEKVVTDEEIYGEELVNGDREKFEARIADLRLNLSVVPRGDSYFAIVYQAGSPMKAFQIAQRMGQLFIEETNRRKRSESRNAYEFINNQVRSYENQLAAAEARLQAFLSENVDGTESAANSRLDSLRSQLELAQLEKSELQARQRSLEFELTRVDPTIRQGRTQDAYQTRISAMEEQLDTLRLKYHDTYPDIVILREQLQELRRQRTRELASGPSEAAPIGDESVSNPVFQDIQTELTATRANLQTINSRINSFQKLLADQAARMERIQEKRAQYLELTRDMEVNKEIYDDLLKRREKARVSMHLDVEGQGLNYRINEKAQFPLSASGPGFEIFAAAGLFLGIAAPFGLAAGLLQVDPRVRAREQIEETTDLPVLVELPKVRTPFEQRRDRKVSVVICVFAVAATLTYLAVAGAALIGVLE